MGLSMSKKKLAAIFICITIFAALIIIYGSNSISVLKNLSKKPVVVIDPGHGESDPGKVGINNVLEKDINLSIAQYLKKYLEAEGVKVVLTRTKDMDLSDANASNKKVSDLKKRIEIIEKASPDFVISIHQNSFPSEKEYGAQVFYFDGSKDSNTLASLIQHSIVASIPNNNKRLEKSNNNYYILKNTSCPIVIVECGFLSNSKEAGDLSDTEYQKEIAWAIYKGALEYINLNSNDVTEEKITEEKPN